MMIVCIHVFQVSGGKVVTGGLDKTLMVHSMAVSIHSQKAILNLTNGFN